MRIFGRGYPIIFRRESAVLIVVLLLIVVLVIILIAVLIIILVVVLVLILAVLIIAQIEGHTFTPSPDFGNSLQRLSQSYS